eukprot:2106868-Pyramimonas_sp.AAC.1
MQWTASEDHQSRLAVHDVWAQPLPQRSAVAPRPAKRQKKTEDIALPVFHIPFTPREQGIKVLGHHITFDNNASVE